MLTNFENITTDLTPQQFTLITPLCEILKTATKANKMKNSEIRFYLMNNTNIYVDEVIFRTLINVIRTNSILPVIGTSHGYYVSYDRTEIEKGIQSQEERIRQQQRAADGLKKFLNV
ncbi:MAG: hypothetical protein IPN10_03035 [Saprospiraceae bacterium]|nr:hypothetical protein [Saprospiraceae bacterium]